MARSKKNIKLKQIIITAIIIIIFMVLSYISENISYNIGNAFNDSVITNYDSINELPEYSGEIYAKINNGIPYFDEEDYTILNYGNDEKNIIKVPNALIPFWTNNETILYYKNGKFNRDI